jgi:hypothetical protein
MKYAASTNSFYLQEIHGDAIPPDAIEISDDQYAALFAGQQQGKRIAAGEDGLPILIGPSLEEAKAAQIAAVRHACEAAIFAGFECDALGTPHTYPAKDRDQQNLAASVLASIMPGLPANWTTPFWCADANGNWAFVNHTAAQIQAVGTAGKAAILANLETCQGYEAAIAAAQTPEAVAAISWGS